MSKAITMVVQIGNSDDKLSQGKWSNYIDYVHDKIKPFANEIHFNGGSSFDAPWQNACFVLEIDYVSISKLRTELTSVKKLFDQDSIAITCGDTEFI